MARLLWAPRALADIERLYGFLVRHEASVAMRAVEAIRTGVKALRSHPGMGRPVDDMPGEFREYIIPFGSSAYIAMYRVEENLVVILAIRHAREAGYY